jgi:hypothetical protein
VGLTKSLYIYDSGSNSQLYFAGGMDLTILAPGAISYPRLVYCVELERNILVPGNYSTAMDFSDTDSLKRVGWLMQNYWPSSPTFDYKGVELQDHGAGFQLAIWDILQDSGNGFGTASLPGVPGIPAGTVSQSTDLNNPTDPNVLADAVEYELLSEGQSSDYGIVYKNWDSNGIEVQTLMGPTPDDGPSAPEPADVILIFSGLALIGLSRMRRSARTN